MDDTTTVEGYLYGLFASDEPMLLWECRYIGETTQPLKDRLRVHNGDARRGVKSKRCNWIKSVVARGASVEMRVFETHQAIDKRTLKAKLHEREIIWIAEGRRQGWRLTNGTNGGDGVVGLVVSEENRRKTSELMKGNKYGVGGTGPLGHKWTDEARAKQSAAKKGKPLNLSDETRSALIKRMQGNTYTLGYEHTPETRAKISDALIGNQHALGTQHTDETRALWSEQRTGRPVSDETRAKLSAINTGRKMSPDVVEKNRQAQTGKKQSQETKDKKNAKLRGQTRSPETRQRMSEAQKGRVVSQETREKMSASAKARCERERLEKEQAANDDG